MVEAIEDQLFGKLKILADQVWGKPLTRQDFNEWLRRFVGVVGDESAEKIHALYLLSNFMYFGEEEIRELLKASYRDLIEYPLIERIRKKNQDTTDLEFLRLELEREINRTLFVGLGSPAESGTHLLYYFRQENNLGKSRFLDAYRLLKREKSGEKFKRELRFPDVRRYVFLDDLCASGETVELFSEDVLEELIDAAPDVEIKYISLFATSTGLNHVRKNSLFRDNCAAVFELDDSYKSVSPGSRYFKLAPSGIDREFAYELARCYGEKLCPDHPLGYQDGQLLLGFAHNTPDNTLPIIWCEGEECEKWYPVFKRHQKF
ncbi:MAG: hypothetical protein KF771_05755 [Burkholderiales bacterium]|nr:hypothetical protein [Burkholderiales bacterium]